MESRFRVSHSSDQKFNYMTAIILYDGQILCQINQDDGIGDSMEIEFFYDAYILEVEPRMKFSLGEFHSIIEYVKEDLPNYRVDIDTLFD